MDKENDDLLLKAIRWYVRQYGDTPERNGLKHSAIWYKPIMKYSLRICKLPEVVFGETEKDVRLFIKAQRILRWGVNLFIFLMPLLGIMLLSFVFLFKPEMSLYFWGVEAVLLIVCVGYFIIGRYTSGLQKQINNDRIVTFMDH